jgi:hypothetical protein
VPLASASKTETPPQLAPVDTGFQPTTGQVFPLCTIQPSGTCERPYINQPETQREPPSTAAQPRRPEFQRHYDYNQHPVSSLHRIHNEQMLFDVPFRPQHRSEDWPGTQDLTSQRYHNPNAMNPFVSSTDLFHVPQLQSMAEQVDNSIHTQLDYTKTGWTPTLDPSALGFRYG